MSWIWLFKIIKNPKAVAFIVVAGVIVATITYIHVLKKRYKESQERLTIAELDATGKRDTIIILCADTSFYRSKLRASQRIIDEVQQKDKKQNPGLVQKLPDIEKLKRK